MLIKFTRLSFLKYNSIISNYQYFRFYSQVNIKIHFYNNLINLVVFIYFSKMQFDLQVHIVSLYYLK